MYPKLTMWVKFRCERRDKANPWKVDSLERVSKMVAWRG